MSVNCNNDFVLTDRRVNYTCYVYTAFCNMHPFNIALSRCSVFDGKRIPYPKREFLSEDEDEKPNTGASKAGLVGFRSRCVNC